MAVRTSMANLITKVRSLINDPSGGTPVFADQDVQDQLDATRLNIRYEQLTAAPDIVNAASTGNSPTIVWSDFYSRFAWWEDDIVLQGNVPPAAWVVLTPIASVSENFYGHWAFELTPFVNGTAPGQFPPVFATGKSYDVWLAAANLLEMWSAQYAGAYDYTGDGQTFRRSQIMDQKLKLAAIYRRKARVVSTHPLRTDLHTPTGAHVESVPLLGSNDQLDRR